MSQRNEEWVGREIATVSHWLIRHAASRAPEALSSRLEEEWLADLECRSSPHENDQQHQHHVDQRGHVDFRIGPTFVAADGHGHGGAP